MQIQVNSDLFPETVTAEPHADYSKLASSDSLRSCKAALSVCCAESVSRNSGSDSFSRRNAVLNSVCD